MYRIGQRANAGDFDIEFDTAKIKEKYRDDPKYAKSERLPDGTPVELQEEIDIAGALMQMVPSSQKLAQYYRAPQNRSQQNGVWPATETTRTKGVINPYEYKSIDGERMAADGKSRQEMAASMPFFIDEFGKRQPLKSEHIPSFFKNTRRFAVVPVTTTGPDGDLLEVPGLQAIPRNSPGYGMEMLGGNGPQPLNRNAAQAALYATYNGVVFWANAAKAALGEKQTSDVEFWAKAYNNLGNTQESTAADIERHFGGDWTDGAVPDLERGAITLGARGPGPTQERINAMVQDVHNNLEGYKAAAKQGDVKSRLALEMYNAHQGNTGRGFLERYADRFKIYQDASTFNPSENVEAHGMFGSAEGLGTLFGDMTGFLLPQKAGASLLAQALLKTGSKSLVTRGIINGMTPQLSSLGQRTVAVGSASIPSLTMGQIVYQSARDVGYSHDQAKVQAIVALPIMSIAEMAIGRQWMIRSYMDKGGANATRDKIGEWLSREIPERMSPLNKALMINSKLAQWWAKEPAGRFGGWAKNSLDAMYTEGKQEGFEEGMYALLEWATDWMTNENRFEKSRPEDYSWSGRVLESAVGGFVGTMPMAMMNNGRSRPNPYDKGVAGAVAEGKGKEILDRAATMRQAGTLTEDDVNVLTQDVRLSENIMREFNVADPKTLNLLLQEQDMVTEYAQRRMEMEGINKQLADLNEQPLAEGQTVEQREAEKAELEKSLEVNKQAVAKILDGTELLNRLKQRVMLMNSIDAKDEGFADSEQVDVITKRFTDWTAAREARIEEVNLFRHSIGTELSDAIDNLSTAKTSKILEAILGYRQAQSKMSAAAQGNAMTREEVQEGYAALANAKEALIADLAKMEALSDTSPNTSFDEAHAAEDPSGALEFEQWITSGLNPQRINALPESDERSIAFRELQILNDQMSMFGKTQAERDAIAQQYMPAAELEGKRSQADLLAEFLKSHPTGDDASVASFRGAIERFKLTETPSIADIQTLASLINLAKSNKEVFKHYSTTMHQVAEKFFGDEKLVKAGSAQSGSSIPPAFAQFKQEKLQVYDPAATIDANQLNQELTDIIADLERQLERMKGMVNKRKEELDQIRRVDLMLRGSLLLKLAGTAGKLSTKPEFIETVKLMQAELDAFASTPGAIPNDNYEVLVNRAEDMVSELLVTGDETGIALIKETYGDLLNGQLKSASNYYETKSIDNASFPARFNEELFLDGGQKPSIVKAMAGFQYMVGWVSRLSRNRHATVLDAYARFVGTTASTVGYAPNEEQQQRVIEASSFLSNPDHDLTHKLTTIVAPLAQGAIIIPRAITIPGMPGVGKTKMLIPAIVNTVANIKGRKLRVGIVAPGTKNVAELSSAIVMSTKEYTHEPVHITDMSNPPKDLDLIIYDEAHVMDGNAVLQMKGMMEKLPETGALMLGDPAQVPSLRNMSYTFPVQRASMRTAPLQVSFRHNNAEVLRSIDSLRSYIAGGTQNSIVLPASHYTKNNHGVRYMSGGGISSIYNAFGAHLSESVNNSEFSGDAILIVKDEAQRQEAILAMAKISAFTSGHEARILTMDGGEHSVLGLEANVAFVALDPAGFDNAFGRFLYTAISRGKNGAVALLPNGQSSEVDKITPIPSDGQSLNEISARVRGYLSAVHRDLAPRVPADVVPTAPTAPAPPTTAPTDPNEPVVQKGRAPGAMVQVNSKFKKSKQGQAMQDLHGEYLTVVEDDGKVTKVRRQNGDELRIKNGFLKNAKGTPAPTADPNEAEPTTDNEEEPVDDKEPEPPIPNEAPTSTRVTNRSSASGDSFIGFSSVFTWNEQFPDNAAALTRANPAFAMRMDVMKAIWSDPSSFTLRLVKRKQGRWTGHKGLFQGVGVEVHVNDGVRLVNRILRTRGEKEMTAEQIEKAGYTMIGGLALNSLAANSPFITQTQELLRQLDDPALDWKEGQTTKDYSAILPGKLYEGIRIGSLGKSSKSFKEFSDDLTARGMFVTDPVMVHLGSKSFPAWQRTVGDTKEAKPAIVVKVSAWEGAPTTDVFLQTKEADTAFYNQMLGQLDNVIDEISRVSRFDRDNLEQTTAFQFVQWNRSLLIKDGQFVLQGLDEFMTISGNGYARMLRGTREQGMTPTRWANDLQKAVKLLQDSQMILTKPAIIDNRAASGLSGIKNPEDLIPSADQVNLPQFSVQANATGAFNDGGKKVAPPSAPMRKRITMPGDTSRTVSQEAASNYYRKVFGDRFVDNQLDFRSNLADVNNVALHGVMDQGYITLGLDKEGRVKYGVDRHEAVHRVLDMLLDDQSRREILHEASLAYAKKHNISYWQVTDKQANEFIAEQYESFSYDTSTRFGRFMQWFRAMLGRWGLYRNRIGELLYRIENGEFRGAEDNDLGGRSVIRHSVREDGELPAMINSETPASGREPEQGDEARSVNEDMAVLANIFTSHASAVSIIDDTVREIMEESLYAPPAEVELVRSMPTLAQGAAKVLQRYARDREAIEADLQNADGSIKSYAEATQADVLSMDEEQWTKYVTWQKGDPSVFTMIARVALPGANISEAQFADAVQLEESLELDVDVYENTTAMAHDTNENLDVFKRQSDLARLSLQSMTLIMPSDKGPSRVVGEPYDVDLNLMNFLVQEAAQFSFAKTGVSTLESLAEAVLAARAVDPTSNEGLYLHTFYKRYLDPDGYYLDAAGNKIMSYAYMIANAGHLLSQYTPNTKEYENLNSRIDVAERVLGNVVRMLAELQASNRWLAEHYQGEGNDETGTGDSLPQPRFNHKRLTFDAISELYNTMKTSLRDPFFANGFASISLDNDFRSKWSVDSTRDKKTFQFKVTEEGVFDAAGNKMVSRKGVQFSINEAFRTQPEAFAEFFAAVGYPVTARTLDYLLSDQSKTGGSKGNSQLLPSLVGLWAYSIHAGIHRIEQGKKDSSLFSNKVISDYSALGGVGEETAGDVGEGRTDDFGVDNYPMPSMFFALNRELAGLENRTKGGSYMQRMIGATGKTIYATNLANAFSRLLPGATTKYHSSQAMEMMADDLVARDPSLLNKDGVPLVPIIDKSSSTARISNVYLGSGITSRSNDSGKNANKLSQGDAFSIGYDLFVRDILSSRKEERLSIAGTPFGDRDAILLYELNIPTGDRNQRLFKKTKESVTVNKAPMANWLKDMFQYRRNVANNSIASWTKFFGMPKNTKASEVLAKLNASQGPGFKDQVRRSVLLAQNSDYVISGDKVSFGHAIMMDDSGIYTRRNSDAMLNPQADIIAVMDEIISPYFQAFEEMVNGKTETVETKVIENDVEVTKTEEVRVPGIGWNHPDVKVDADGRRNMMYGYFVMSHLVNNWVGTVIDGGSHNYKNAQDYIKRSVTAFSPGHEPLIGGQFGMPLQPRIAVFSEFTTTDKYGNNIKHLDGQGYTTPWGWAIARRAFGGQEGLVKASVNKRIISTNNIKVKYSEAVTSPELYRKNLWLQQITQRSLMAELTGVDGAVIPGTPLLDAWNSAIGDANPEAFAKATDAVMEKAQELGVSDQLIHMITSESNVKMGLRGVNQLDASEESNPLQGFLEAYSKSKVSQYLGEPVEFGEEDNEFADASKFDRQRGEALGIEGATGRFGGAKQKWIKFSSGIKVAFRSENMISIPKGSEVTVRMAQEHPGYDLELAQLGQLLSVATGPVAPRGLVSIPVDARFWRLQTVLERTTDPDKMRAPYFTQLSSLLGVSTSEISRQQLETIRAIEKKISERYLNYLSVSIAGQSGKTRTEKVQEWMRSIGLKKMSSDGRTGQFVDMLTNPNSDINNPVLRSKLVELLANELTRNGINPKLHGQMFTQVTGYGLSVPNEVEEEFAWEESSFNEDEARANASADYDNMYPYEGYISEGDETEPDFDPEEARAADKARYQKEKDRYVDRRVLGEKERAPKLKRKPLDFQRMDNDPSGDLRGRTLNRFRFKKADKSGEGPFGTVFKTKGLSFLSLDDDRWSSSSSQTGGVKLKAEQFLVSKDAKIARLTSAEEYRSLLASLGSGRYPTNMDTLIEVFEGYDAIQYVPPTESEVDPDGRARLDKMMGSLGGAQLIVINKDIISKVDEKELGSEEDLLAAEVIGDFSSDNISLSNDLSGFEKSMPASMKEVGQEYLAQEKRLRKLGIDPDEEFNEVRKRYKSAYDAEVARLQEATTPKQTSKKAMRELLPPSIENGQYMPGEIMIKFVHAATFGITDPSMPIDAMKEQILREQGEAGLAAFERYLYVFVVRTPSSGLGSGQWMKIVGFINDSGNSIYVPAGMNVPTGGDNDGDQLSVYFRNVKAQVDKDDETKFETVEPLSGPGSQQAYVLNALWDFYADPANAEMIIAATGTEALEKVAKELAEEFQDTYKSNAMLMELFTPSHNSMARKMASDGAQLIGIGAQHMKSYGYMMEAAVKTMDSEGNSPLFDGWMPQTKDSTGRPVMANINQLLNGMLDNTKLMVMGQLGVNSYNVNLLMGAIMNGASMKEAFLMIKDPLVQKAVLDNENADSYGLSDRGIKKQDVIRLIGAEIDKLLPTDAVRKQMREYETWKQSKPLEDGTKPPMPNIDGLKAWGVQNPDGMNRIRDLRRIRLAASIGEASSAMARVFSINTKGVPHSMEAIKSLQADTRETLGISWAGLANNKEASRGRYGHVINARGILEQIPSMIGFYHVAEFARQSLADGVLMAHPLVEWQHTYLLRDLGLKFMPGDAGRDWENMVDQTLIVAYLNTKHSDSKFRLTKGMEPISLSGPGGHYRYVMEFPGFLSTMIARVERLKNSDPRKVLLKQNAFLNSIRIAEKGTPRIEVPKAKKIMNDARESEAVRRSAERLDEIFTGDVAKGLNIPVSQMLTIYSMIKDKFSVGSTSLAKFVPIKEYLQYDAFVSSLHAGVVQYGVLHKQPIDGGTQLSIEEMLERTNLAFIANHPRLLPVSEKSAMWKGSRYVAIKKKVGSARVYEISDVTTGERLINPWSQLGTVVDLSSSKRYSENSHKRLSWSDYSTLQNNLDLEIPLEYSLSWDEGPVTLPTGQLIRWEKTENNTVLLDADTLSGAQKLKDNEDPALANNILKVDSNGFAKSEKSAYGPGHMELKGKQLKEALKMLQSKTEHLMYRQLAKFLGEQLQIHNRDSYVSNMRSMRNGEGFVSGRIMSTGDIQVSDAITQLDAEHTLLHEALHRFLMGVMNAPEASLNAWEAEFRKKVETIFNEVKSLDPKSDHYGMKDVHEFLSGTLTNEDFQQYLRSLAPGSKQNIFWRIINAIRSLFPGWVRNDYVNRITSLSYDYIKRSSRSGIDRMPMGEAFRISNAAQHGLSPQFKPVTDIRDLVDRFQTDPKAFITHEERQASQYVERLFNRLDRSRIAQELDGIRFSVDGMTDTQIREHLRKNVMPKVSTSDAQTKLKVMDVMNMAGDLEQNWNTKMVFADGNPMTTKETAKWFKEASGHRTGAIYLQYTDLKDPNTIITTSDGRKIPVSDLGIKYVPGFDGFNPIVQVYVDGNGKKSVSLLDPTTRGNLGGDTGAGPYLLSVYMHGPFQSALKKLRTHNSSSGARTFLMGLTAMAMKQANPNISFHRIKALSLKDGKDGGVWMSDFIHEVRLLKNIPAFMNEVPDNIKAVLNDETLFNMDAYNQPFLQQYIEFLRTSGEGGSFTETAARDRLRTAAEKAMFSEEGSNANLLDAIRYRQRMMQKDYKQAYLVTDPEYIMLAHLVEDMNQHGRTNPNSIRDTSMVGHLLKNTHNIQSDVVQTVVRKTEQAVMKLAAKNGVFRAEMTARIKALEEKSSFMKVPGGVELADRGWKRFEAMWRLSGEEGVEKVYRKDGTELIGAHTNTLHWNKNDPATAAKLKAGKLTQAELDFANYALDEIHKAMVDKTVHDYKMDMRHWDPVTGIFDETLARKEAEAFVTKHYPRGWVPVVRRPASEAVFNLKFKEAFSTSLGASANVDAIYAQDADRVSGENAGEREKGRVSNTYGSELEIHEPLSKIGGSTRLRRMGLEIVDGKLISEADERNMASTMNLEIILNYVRLATDRQIIHEEETVPVYNGARALLLAKKLEESVEQVYNLKSLEDYAMRMIYNEPIKDSFNVMGVNPAPIMNMAISASSFIGVAWNWKVALASGVMNNLQMLGFSIASGIADDGLFSAKHFAEAAKRMTNKKDRDKMAALMEKHFINEWQQQDLADSFNKSHTRKLLFSGHAMNIGNFWTDNNTRGMVMMAQMLKDGSWDAYSLTPKGEVVYDEKKDRRWYGADGKLTEDGGVLIKEVKRRLIEQGVVDQKENEPLRLGYDLEMGRTFKWIADKYIIGGMDASQKANLSSAWYGRMFTTFKTYMMDRIYNWHGRDINSDAGGRLVVKTDASGKKMAVWERREITSYVTALGNLFKMVADYREMGTADFKNMRPADKRALAKLSYDAILCVLCYLIYNGLKDDDDEDNFVTAPNKQSAYTYERKMFDMLKQIAWDGAAGSAPGLVYTMAGSGGGSAIPVLNNAWRLMNVPLHPEKALYFVPGGATFADIHDLLSDKTIRKPLND